MRFLFNLFALVFVGFCALVFYEGMRFQKLLTSDVQFSDEFRRTIRCFTCNSTKVEDCKIRYAYLESSRLLSNEEPKQILIWNIENLILTEIIKMKTSDRDLENHFFATFSMENGKGLEEMCRTMTGQSCNNLSEENRLRVGYYTLTGFDLGVNKSEEHLSKMLSKKISCDL